MTMSISSGSSEILIPVFPISEEPLKNSLGEDRCVRLIPKQPLCHGDDGIYYLGGWCLQAKLAEFLRVHLWVFRGVVGEEDHTFAELAQLADQTLRAG